MKKLLIVAAICFLSVGGCNSKPDDSQTESYQFDGKCHEPVAMIMEERNGVPDISGSGSGFLAIKKKGIFATAGHVVGDDADFKIFFCGHVYHARRILAPVATDASFFQITSQFDSESFPEPYDMPDNVSAGDEIFVRGIHPHSRSDTELGGVRHQIMGGYYKLTNSPTEFVYDNLAGRITRLDVYESNKAIHGLGDAMLESVVQSFLEAKVLKDHANGNIGFQGLSGGPTVNNMRQLVGINSWQLGNEGISILDETGFHYEPRVTLNLVPYTELQRLLPYINNASY